MKSVHLIALAATIALIHLLVIFLVMSGGCASRQEKMPEKPVLTEEKSILSFPSSSVTPGKYPPADEKDVRAVIPGAQKKSAGIKADAPQKKGKSLIPDSLLELEEIPPLPEMDGSQKTKSSGKVVKMGDLPPPARRRGILKRGKYDYRYAVRGRISAVPGLAHATSGILLHVNTRRILWAKNPRRKVAIASMSKIMTMLLACEDVESGRVLLTNHIPATKGAMAIREGVVWMRRGETFTLQSLLEAAAVKSANDAAFLIAEYLGNGESRQFIARMNQTAKEFGMLDTRFYNPHGLPGKRGIPDNTSTPEDILKLSEYAMTSPLFCELVQIRKCEFREKGNKGHLVFWNHNRLLPGARYGVNGVKGIKTGYTRRAGFCLAVACEKDGEEYIAVATGFPSSAKRDSAMRSLLQWGFIRSKNPALPEERVILKSRVSKKSAVKRRVVKKKNPSGKRKSKKNEK